MNGLLRYTERVGSKSRHEADEKAILHLSPPHSVKGHRDSVPDVTTKDFNVDAKETPFFKLRQHRKSTLRMIYT